MIFDNIEHNYVYIGYNGEVPKMELDDYEENPFNLLFKLMIFIKSLNPIRLKYFMWQDFSYMSSILKKSIFFVLIDDSIDNELFYTSLIEKFNGIIVLVQYIPIYDSFIIIEIYEDSKLVGKYDVDEKESVMYPNDVVKDEYYQMFFAKIFPSEKELEKEKKVIDKIYEVLKKRKDIKKVFLN